MKNMTPDGKMADAELHNEGIMRDAKQQENQASAATGWDEMDRDGMWGCGVLTVGPQMVAQEGRPQCKRSPHIHNIRSPIWGDRSKRRNSHLRIRDQED